MMHPHFTCPRQAGLSHLSLPYPFPPSVTSSPNLRFHLHRLPSHPRSRPSPPPPPPLSALASSQQTQTQKSSSGSGLVALWWMHFHRPISVILKKQVSASILSGLYSFLSATHPTRSFRIFHLLPPSFSAPPPFSEGHSLILLSIDGDPVTLSLKAWLSHIEQPSPCLTVLTRAWTPTPRSRTGWHRAPKQ